MKTRKGILRFGYDRHAILAAQYSKDGHWSMVEHHQMQMAIHMAELMRIEAEEWEAVEQARAATLAEKPSAIDQVKFVAMSGYDSVAH